MILDRRYRRSFRPKRGTWRQERRRIAWRCLLYRADDKLPDREIVMEPHLALGRMDVHIDPGRIHLQKQDRHRVAPLHQRIVVTLEQAEMERPIFNGTLVDEEKLFVTRGAADPWLADESVQA